MSISSNSDTTNDKPDEQSTPSNRRRFLKRSASIVGAASVGGVAVACGSSAETTSPEASDDPLAEKPRRSDIEAQVVAKAWRDDEYKRQLMANPREVLSRELDTDIPERVNIQVLEEQENTLYFVLPRNPNDYSRKEMTGEEVLLLAAGVRFDTPCDTVASLQPAWFVELGYEPRSNDPTASTL